MPDNEAERSERPVLPGPEDRPGTDIVIYDGDCSFCIRQVQRLARWDGGKRLSFLGRQDPRADELLPDLDAEDALSEMRVIDRQGKRHGGARAVRYLSRRLPRLWWAAPLLHIPGSMLLWNWLYRRVAKRRYRWSQSADCENGTCRAPAGDS